MSTGEAAHPTVPSLGSVEAIVEPKVLQPLSMRHGWFFCRFPRRICLHYLSNPVLVSWAASAVFHMAHSHRVCVCMHGCAYACVHARM